jgi:hypothetical protein
MVLDPQPLSRQQRLTLIGLDPSLQRLVGCIQPLIRNVSFRLYALDDFERGGFFAAKLESRANISASTGSAAIKASTATANSIRLKNVTSIPAVCARGPSLRVS